MTLEFAERKEEIKKLRKIWHQEVDNIFDKADKIISSMQELNMASISRHQNQMKGKMKEMEQTIKEQQEVSNSNIASKINGYKSKIRDYKEIPKAADVKVPSLITNTVQGEELRMEIATIRAKLSQSLVTSLFQDFPNTTKGILIDSNVIATIPTYFNRPNTVACVGSDEAWISGCSVTIKRLDIHGSVQDKVTIIGHWPTDISVTQQGELIYSDYTSDTVNIVSQGAIQILIIPPQGWRPWGLCCTRCGDILVNLKIGYMNAIVQYKGGKIAKAICKDDRGKLIFTEGKYSLYMAENNNGDICITDINAGKVVVVDRSGKVRFRYDGTPARRQKSFAPRAIVTDSISQIIVADYNNDCLHILDQDGNFLRCVDNCGLDKPCGLSLDNKGRLWVALDKTGNIKVLSI